MHRNIVSPAARAAIALGMMGLAACATQPQVRQPIEVQSVRLTGAGHYLDLRYRVLDPAAAQAALGPTVRPRLIDEVTGSAMAVPMTAKLGALRQTQAVQKPDRTYFVMFVNSSGMRPGSKVTAELGELKFPHLTVE